MKKSIFFMAILFFGLVNFSNAQVQAVTEYGDTIYVFDDGTWSYSLESEVDPDDFDLSYLQQKLNYDTLDVKFTCETEGKRSLTSRYEFFKIFYDDTIWERIPPGQLNDEAEFAFVARDKDIFCIAIAEEIEVGFDNIVKIALNTLRENTGGHTELHELELRNVNGVDVGRAIFEVNISGLDLIFDSYYWSGEAGTIQFTTWTGSNLHKKYKKNIEGLLNGLVISSGRE